VLALAAALSYAVERPAMRRIRAWWRGSDLQLKSA
jgi:hypothetical protein